MLDEDQALPLKMTLDIGEPEQISRFTIIIVRVALKI